MCGHLVELTSFETTGHDTFDFARVLAFTVVLVLAVTHVQVARVAAVREVALTPTHMRTFRAIMFALVPGNQFA